MTGSLTEIELGQSVSGGNRAQRGDVSRARFGPRKRGRGTGEGARRGTHSFAVPCSMTRCFERDRTHCGKRSTPSWSPRLNPKDANRDRARYSLATANRTQPRRGPPHLGRTCPSRRAGSRCPPLRPEPCRAYARRNRATVRGHRRSLVRRHRHSAIRDRQPGVGGCPGGCRRVHGSRLRCCHLG